MPSDDKRALPTSSSPVVFPDTNIFLHYTFFTEIPWDTIIGAAQVSIAISPVTIGEIDSQKYSGSSGRVRDRARKVTKKLGDLVDSAERVRPNVEIEFIAHEPVDFDRYQLTRSSQDDQLLATVLQYREAYPQRQVMVVTNDVGLKIKAKSRGIQTLPLPESYLLTEADLNERRVKELERKVLELQNQTPSLRLEFVDGKDRFEVQRPSRFRDETTFVAAGMQKVRQDYPKLDLPSNAVGLASAFRNEVTSQSIRDYNESLEEFFQEFRQYLSLCYRVKETRSRAAKIGLKVKNFGSATAVDVKVFVRFPLEVALKAGTKWQQLPRKPSPPEKPKPTFFSRGFDFSSIGGPYIPPNFNIPSLPQILAEPRITWRELQRDESSCIVSFEVSKLNHGYAEPCPRDIHVVFPSVDAFSSFKMPYEITAGNLPSKSTGSLHVIVKE